MCSFNTPTTTISSLFLIWAHNVCVSLYVLISHILIVQLIDQKHFFLCKRYYFKYIIIMSLCLLMFHTVSVLSNETLCINLDLIISFLYHSCTMIMLSNILIYIFLSLPMSLFTKLMNVIKLHCSIN